MENIFNDSFSVTPSPTSLGLSRLLMGGGASSPGSSAPSLLKGGGLMGVSAQSQAPLTPAQKAALKDGGLGTKWPKGMWDNMDSELKI